MKTFFLLISILFGHQAIADLSIAQQHVDSAQLVGKARLKVLFWSVFDAELYAEEGDFSQDKPFTLSLSYLREIKGSEIVAKSMSEIKSQDSFPSEKLALWKSKLDSIIPDVDTSTTITGVRDSNVHTLFYENGTLIGEIKDPQFTRAFFNIWLGEKTSEPKLRSRLLGLAY